MKKTLAIALALMMLLSLAACGGNKTTAGQKEPASGGAASNDGALTDKDIEDVDKAIEALESMIPEGWTDGGNYASSIYKVWDDAFLPDACFPAPIAGTEADGTYFKDYGDDTINGDYSVGPLWYESKDDYRTYRVTFYATDDQLAEFIAGVETKGLKGGQVNDGAWREYNYGGNGWFMYIFFNTNDNQDGKFAGCVTATATDDLWELPKSIDGIPLPQTGVIGHDCSSYTIFDANNDEVEFDLAGDALPDNSYAAWFNYYGVTMQDAKDYAQQLVGLGWELQYESEDEDVYCSNLHKDGVYAVSNYLGYEAMMEIGFSDMIENLSY